MVSSSDELQARAGALLSPFADIEVKDDGSLGFEYHGALCSLRAMPLSDELDVLTAICLLAWDRPADPELHARIAERNDALTFGTLSLVARGAEVDVLLRYSFPGAGLSDEALTTMLLLVLSGADTARQDLFA
ncbi:MAG: hypothetical protein HOQ24_05045 [Mycobacteriaceae bacterium]|nr:hypothetical protein [Mycobacteriaceae bacterium]